CSSDLRQPARGVLGFVCQSPGERFDRLRAAVIRLRRKLPYAGKSGGGQTHDGSGTAGFHYGPSRPSAAWAWFGKLRPGRAGTVSAVQRGFRIRVPSEALVGPVHVSVRAGPANLRPVTAMPAA